MHLRQLVSSRRCTQQSLLPQSTCSVEFCHFCSNSVKHSNVSYADIKGNITYTQDSLQQLMNSPEPSFLKQLKTSDCLEKLDLELTENTKQILASMQKKYITSLMENTDERFSKCQDIFTAFGIFNRDLLPKRESADFRDCREKEVSLLGSHFFPADVDKLLSE